MMLKTNAWFPSAVTRIIPSVPGLLRASLLFPDLFFLEPNYKIENSKIRLEIL